MCSDTQRAAVHEAAFAHSSDTLTRGLFVPDEQLHTSHIHCCSSTCGTRPPALAASQITYFRHSMQYMYRVVHYSR